MEGTRFALLAFVLAASGANAATITIDADQASYNFGDFVTLLVEGRPSTRFTDSLKKL